MRIRQTVARRTPRIIRKLVRMGEHYVRRYREWYFVLREMSGLDNASKLLLGASFVAAPITALRKLDGFEPPLLLGDTRLRVKGVGAFAIRAKTDDIIHVLTTREPLIRREIERRLRPGDIFVDAGANIGFYTVLAARLVGERGAVLAVEMMPQTATSLRNNVALNNLMNVQVIERALSDHAGRKVNARVENQKYGQASIVAEIVIGQIKGTVEVKTTTISDILTGLGRVRLIKMDLEGAEFLALTGAVTKLSNVDAIIFENNRMDTRIPALLESAGFRVSNLFASDFLAERESCLTEI